MAHVSPLPATSPFPSLFLFFNEPAPPEIYSLSLHDALPISSREVASLVSGLRSMSTALPISMESLTGSRNSLMRSIVDVGDEVDLLFVFVLVFVLVLMMSDIGVSCTVELG